MEITVLAIGVALAAMLGVALGRYVWPTVPESHRSALASAQVEIIRLDNECSTLRGQLSHVETEYKTTSDKVRTTAEEVARLTERVAGLSKQNQEQTKQTATLEAQREAAASEVKTTGAEVARLIERVATLTKQTEELRKQTIVLESQRETAANETKTAGAEVARLTERVAAYSDKIEVQAAQLANQQKQLTAEFENIATRVLKANATELSENSQKELSAILEPLRERIQDFQNKVESTYTAENREVLSLKEQIKLILETSHAIGNQADGLAKALRGDSQLLGRWGELALERILEAAGLTEGREYISQGRGLGLKNESGRAQRPDIIVNLPEQRTMIGAASYAKNRLA